MVLGKVLNWFQRFRCKMQLCDDVKEVVEQKKKNICYEHSSELAQARNKWKTWIYKYYSSTKRRWWIFTSLNLIILWNDKNAFYQDNNKMQPIRYFSNRNNFAFWIPSLSSSNQEMFFVFIHLKLSFLFLWSAFPSAGHDPRLAALIFLWITWNSDADDNHLVQWPKGRRLCNAISRER